MARVAVIGKGLFGVAAALHLSRIGHEVVLIGPDEPEPGDDSFRGPFGAHFDEARILVARGDRAEIDLTIQTMLGIMELQDESREEILVQSGSVEVYARGQADRRLVDGVVDVGSGAELVEVAPPQGFYNPRAYVRAGVAVLERNGAQVIREPAAAVRADRDGSFVVVDGPIRADRIVVAAGAWSNRFLKRPVALRLKREHVLFAQLADAVAESITMRPVVIRGRTGAVEDIYILPPRRYPDGRWYLKLGANTLHDEAVAQDAAIDGWYREGDSTAAEPDLVAAFREVIPDLAVEEFRSERCVITYTTHGRPYIDAVAGAFVCVGGNGHGASWADGAGKLVAALVSDEPWENFEREAFAAVPDDKRATWPRPLLMRDRI